jgi:hypothetical protein
MSGFNPLDPYPCHLYWRGLLSCIRPRELKTKQTTTTQVVYIVSVSSMALGIHFHHPLAVLDSTLLILS